MQRNENFFFCVDQDNGEIIPETNVDSNSYQPINEQICQTYSSLCKYKIEPKQ